MQHQARLSFARKILLPAAALVALARPAASDPVKLVKPEQYRARVVAAKKGRVLLVKFWATWCDPCREEMPALVSAAKGFSSKDLAVALVSTDSLKKTAEVQRFLAAGKIPFICWQVKSPDPQRFIDAVDKSWDGAVPYTLVYDRKGELVARLAGPQTEKSFGEAVRKALAPGS
jgi:thiol-disulfide isomerase/thioredoxin